MKAFHRLLMAGTVLSGVVSIQMAEAGIASGAPAPDKATLASAITLGQAGPAKQSAAPPRARPAPPSPPAAHPVPPPAVQAPARPQAPPAAPSPPRVAP